MNKNFNHRIAICMSLIGIFAGIYFWVTSDGVPLNKIEFGHEIVQGRFPENGSLIGDQISVLWVTNSSNQEISLSVSYAEFEEEKGRSVRNHVISWNKEDPGLLLKAGASTWIAMELKPKWQRWRYCLEIPEKGNLLFRTASIGARFLHKHFSLPRSVQSFFSQHGLIDGYRSPRYKSPWVEATSLTNP